MESLPDAEARRLTKMSTAYLKGKLMANLQLIGATADQVEKMSRATLLDTMANLCVLLKEPLGNLLGEEGGAGPETVEAESVSMSPNSDGAVHSIGDEENGETETADPGPASVPPNSNYVIQMEILKLQLKLQREQAAAAAAAQREQAAAQLVQQQHEREMKDKDIEIKQIEAARAEQLKREELDVKRLELAQQHKREEQPVILLKRFAEALKGVMHPQPADPCGLPLYFDNLERVYKQFQVPVELQASLLIPYLNTKTQTMITRLSAADLASYTKLKDFILVQHKLTSKDYRQRFSQSMREPNETYVPYVSRLSTLQDYWLRSKEVKTFEGLCDLHVLEKLHDTLHPLVLKHVLTVEADQNVTAMRAAQIADIFEGNLSSDSKLRYQIEHFEPDSV